MGEIVQQSDSIEGQRGTPHFKSKWQIGMKLTGQETKKVGLMRDLDKILKCQKPVLESPNHK